MVRRRVLWCSRGFPEKRHRAQPLGDEGDELLSNKRAKVQSNLLKTVSLSLGAKESRIDASSRLVEVQGPSTTEVISWPTSLCWTTATSSCRWRIHLTTGASSYVIKMPLCLKLGMLDSKEPSRNVIECSE